MTKDLSENLPRRFCSQHDLTPSFDFSPGSKAMDRHFTDQAGLCVFPILNARHGLMAGVVPDSGCGSSCRETIDAVRAAIEQLTPLDTVATLTLFVAKAGTDQAWTERVAEIFPPQSIPSLTCVAQPSCEPNQIGFEAYIVSGEKIFIDRNRSDNCVTIEHDGLHWFHCGQIDPLTNVDVYTDSASMFRRAHDLLAKSGCHFNRVIRTWLYEGNILGREEKTVRYHELNRARADFFERDISIVAPYPASTGIGQAGTEVTMSCLALASEETNAFRNVALENPLQTSAFDYEKKYGRKSPKFSRAMATVFERQAILWVSGTASITESETRHHDDVAAQTRQTLENIRSLISAENLARHGINGLGADLHDLVSARVYIKNRSEYEVVRSICESLLAQTPVIYVEADICRDDLLVEIEAVAYGSSDRL